MEGMEDEDTRRETQNLAYPPAFKLEVALHAKRYSQYAAAKIFSVARYYYIFFDMSLLHIPLFA